MKKINIGLIGFGTIGSGVAETLLRKKGFLAKLTGSRLSLNYICDKDIKTNRGLRISRTLLTVDAKKVLSGPKIDIVVELIGGINPAREFILTALKNKKAVVTANKALLAEHGNEIFGASKKYNTPILFEASVGGGIPIIKALREGFVSNKIDSVYGIINGTCNYILSKMSDEGITFRAALRSAQKMGVAEANPSLDIKGIDSAHKLAILAMLGFKVLPDMKQIYCEGILDIEPCDIKYAREMGYEIKLLAIAKKSADKVEARVHPTLIAKEHLLANVKGVYNAIYVKGDLIGESLFYGKGAGKQPTASAVVSDIVDLARGCSQPPLVFSQGAGRIKQVGEIKSKFYIRFSAIDKPGVLSSISGILSKYNISISSVTQKQERREKVVPIVMMTHMAQEKNLQKALKAVNALPTIRKKSVAIRMETL